MTAKGAALQSVPALQAGGKTDAAIAFAAVFGSAQEKGA
jgi:hypothetical protein